MDTAKLQITRYRNQDPVLAGRTILVTGAGAGIGRAVALAYADHGAELILLGRTQHKLESLHDELLTRGAPHPEIAVVDLNNPDQNVYDAVANALEGRVLHGVLHNASALGPRTPIEHFDPDQWDQVMRVNVSAAFRLTRALIPSLRRANGASIIFTSSSVGRKARAYWGAYAVSKFAVEGLMQVLADELFETDGIRCNSINPGRTRTAMRAEAYPAEDPGTLPEPESHRAIYVYLMTQESAGLNGLQLNAADYGAA